MKARIIIEYEVEPEGLTQAQLREREERAWMMGAIAIPDLNSAVVKFELAHQSTGRSDLEKARKSKTRPPQSAASMSPNDRFSFGIDSGSLAVLTSTEHGPGLTPDTPLGAQRPGPPSYDESWSFREWKTGR
jgi:hypothetical protein